ncbi:cytochrome P450 [Nocardia sp. NPDC058114]|uniref:cytochrome P450 n=1 Tax=Nocardia sp. NPDC058114 TaxID=3346346 RepID=UPI0036DAAC9C
MMSTLGRRAKSAVSALAERYPSQTRALADPLPDSGLRPIMGDYGVPVIGHAIPAMSDSLDFARRRFDKYGPVHWVGIAGRRVVMVAGPEATEEVLADRDKVYSAQRGYTFFIGPFFHGGILLRDFEEHRYHRRILQQAFTRPRLVGYLDITSPAIARGMREWTPNRDFQLYPAAKRLLLSLSSEVFMGANLGSEAAGLERAFIDAVRGGQALVRTNLPGGLWARGLRGRAVLEDYCRRELPAKRAGNGEDLFSVLCRTASEEGHTFTDQDIVDHLIFVLLGAHDTSTIAVSMMGYQLGLHPEWQDRLRSESQALGKESLDYADLDRLPTLELVFKEILRMYSPVGQQIRETVRDTAIQGQFVPADTLVMIGSYSAMRQARWWNDPDVFDPERFTTERHEDKAHRYTWAPFGGGAHKCIGLYFGGMTVKAIMHRMLLNYRWTVPADYTPPMGWATGPIPLDGLPIRLEHLGASGSA